MTQGGMSTLYLGIDPVTQDAIIIKVLRPKFLSESDVVERFLNEARAIELANHPNIVRLIESGQWENGLFIAMEFIKGGSLRKILQHQPYSLKRALEVLLQIAYALAHLHTHGIVHGDLKPENIIINEQGQTKVIDFGIAQILSDKKKKSLDRLIGTPIYMSPELLANPHSFSFQSDIYALGIIAYELLLGKISHGRVIISLAPKGMQKILHKALQPNPEDRYKDMCDFVADLSSYVKSGAQHVEKQGSDYFLEIFEKLEELQESILPAKQADWQNLDVAISYLQDQTLCGQYVDFFDFKDCGHITFTSDNKLKGPEGIVHASMLKSSLKTLLKTSSTNELGSIFRKLMELTEREFCFSALVLNPEKMTFEYYQKGYGQLIFSNSESENLLAIHPIERLDGEILHYKAPYQKGDSFLLFAGVCQDANSFEKMLIDTLQETSPQPIQNQIDAIARRVRMRAEKLIEEQAACLIFLQS